MSSIKIPVFPLNPAQVNVLFALLTDMQADLTELETFEGTLTNNETLKYPAERLLIEAAIEATKRAALDLSGEEPKIPPTWQATR